MKLKSLIKLGYTKTKIAKLAQVGPSSVSRWIERKKGTIPLLSALVIYDKLTPNVKDQFKNPLTEKIYWRKPRKPMK